VSEPFGEGQQSKEAFTGPVVVDSSTMLVMRAIIGDVSDARCLDHDEGERVIRRIIEEARDVADIASP
jgi:hypothetical protein